MSKDISTKLFELLDGLQEINNVNFEKMSCPMCETEAYIVENNPHTALLKVLCLNCKAILKIEVTEDWCLEE